DVGNLWRATGDITNKWSTGEKTDGLGDVQILDQLDGLESYAGPGHWNDPDMLEVGNEGLTDTEARAHFSMWCILAAPLIAGNDIRSMTPESRAILTNKDLIAIDQDPLGIQGRRVKKDGDLEVWSKELSDGTRAVALLNRSEGEKEISVAWTEIGYPELLKASVHDLWSGKTAENIQGKYSASVPSHGAVVIRIIPLS